MNSSTTKKRARDLQAITGMPYQSARRAVVEGTEFEASVRSGLRLSDFVTPREVRIWHLVNGTRAFDCAAALHWMVEEVLGQCVGCGAYMAQKYTYDGDTYEATIDEDEYFEQCLAMGMYCNWAPPLAHLARLDVSTQAAYLREHWDGSGGERFDEPAWTETVPAASDADDDPWAVPTTADPDALTPTQVDLLRAVAELHTDTHLASAKDVGARMLELLTERDRMVFWKSYAPWHGTNPTADQLHNADLIEVSVDAASPSPWSQPDETEPHYWFELTDAGRAALASDPPR